jgi:hypothetical protein
MEGPVRADVVDTHVERSSRARQLMAFLGHLGEMILAMLVGMAAGGAVLALLFSTLLANAVAGMTRADILDQYAVLICIVVASTMTAPMVAWMRFRGHDRRLCAEMATAMAVPLVPIVTLLWLGVVPGASACGLYCVAMLPAMLAAMVLRFDRYTGHPHHQGHHDYDPLYN